jgi:putative ABC transport system substrate-binding protein
MKRREFITLVGGAASLPLAARAQQGNRMPRVCMLGVDGPMASVARATFKKALQELGWTDGSNIRIDDRALPANDIDQMRASAKELVSLNPDAILVGGARSVAALQHETKSIPIVFVAVTDPVASGLVASLSHPGGNITGFSNFEPTLVGKQLEILKEIMPGITAVSDMFYADNLDRFRITHPLLEAAARYYAVELMTAPVGNNADIERVISSLGNKPTTGLVVAGEPFMGTRLDLITSLTIRYRVPAGYSFRYYAEGGGLISLGNDLIEEFRRAAGYIDRILKKANPADLPVQLPTKFEMVINLKTAKAMGLTMPTTLITRADEVIE